MQTKISIGTMCHIILFRRIYVLGRIAQHLPEASGSNNVCVPAALAIDLMRNRK
jgi:hypothetical protein